MLRQQGAAFRVICGLGRARTSEEAMGGRPGDPARMFEGRDLYRIEAAGGRAGKEVGRRLT